MKVTKKLLLIIIDCCDLRFSKVVEPRDLGRPGVGEVDVGEVVCFSLYHGQGWDALVEQVLPIGHPSALKEIDTVFLTSDDVELCVCLIGCVDEHGWFENEGAVERHS